MGRMKVLVTILGLAAVLLVAGGIALAHNGDPNVIHACVNNGGQLTIVGANDTCPGSQTSLDWNITGPEGPEGPQGPQGPAGGVSGLERIVALSPSNSNDKTVNAVCPSGKKVTGGGGNTFEAAVGVAIAASFPTTNVAGLDGWEVRAIETEPNAANWRVAAFVICA